VKIVAASLLLVVLWSSRLARAAVGLAYEAPDGCPSRREFVDAVATRGADFETAGTKSADRVLVVTIRKQGNGFAGVFLVRDGAGATSQREVQGAACTEVVDALSVVTAIALRPEAGAPPAHAPPPPPAPPAESHAASPADGRLRGNTFIYHHTHETLAMPAGPLSFDLARALNVYAGIMVGAAPATVMPRFDLSMIAGNFVTASDRSQRIIGLILRSRLTFLGPGTYRSPDTKTTLEGMAFALGGCLTPHYDSAGLILLFCTDIGVGGMNLRTTDLGGTQIQSKFVGFGSIGLGIEMQYNLTSLVNVGIKVGWDTFLGSPPWSAERGDGTQIFAAPANSGYALLGMGFRF
jgi:hypothetical protein